ncbi:MAG TPA: proteasome accessory factor PafA2 family protein [Candidatus Sulfotelmatobacter sp.]|nr:proteasome accessory factor PafA2 family protein [Candidatus Sulfotelmatobacter sp.]
MQQRLNIQFGTETEIGISRERPEALDVVSEAIALVNAANAPGVRRRWDYRCEDPHCDARGFRVQELLQDHDEANYVVQDSQRRLSIATVHSDIVLRNGARFYNDHSHPEYCSPECSTLLEHLQQDYAGDQLLIECARNVNQNSDNPVRLYKNNTDFFGHSYGCHENYLLPRALPWEALSDGMLAFLVTRQVFCGAGKFGWEEEDKFIRPGFQITQRSDFFLELQSIDTMQRRPIINTRDEPHANRQVYRRFHVILGDANLSLYATYLKIGTTALVLQALLNGAPAERVPHLAEPLQALKSISRDRTWKWRCHLADGRETNAMEVQATYLQLVREFCPNVASEWFKLMDDWEEVLKDLERDPLSTANRLDWAAKFKLIDQFRAAENLSEDDPWLQSLDLSYHLMDPQQGLFYGLMDQGAFKLPYPLAEITGHSLCPPSSTRAAVRGLCVERFGSFVQAAQWDHILLRGSQGTIKLDLCNLFDPQKIKQGLDLINAARTVDDLAHLEFATFVNEFNYAYV